MAFFQPFTKTKTKIKKRLTLKLSIVILAFFVLSAPNTWARTFNPHNIITDQDLINKDSLSQAAIQKFLERENSVLARYSQVIDGQTLKASAMIWEIAQKHSISPKFLLTTLEKEQSLIHKEQATEKALDWATGYGCYGGGCKEKYRGFYNQVEATAETQQIYWQKAGQFSFTSGQTTTTFDGYKVTPANKATANLYIYTPYVGYAPELGVTQPAGGNKLFWRIWSRYFTEQKFLDGQILTHDGNYWLIKNNKKNKFASATLFLKDYKTTDAINVSSDDLAAYPDGPEIIFADNTLVKSTDSGQIYLLTENQKRPIINNSALALLEDFQIAITENEITTVSETQIADYTLGTLISDSAIFPQGKLFKDETGKIWQVQDGLKHEVNQSVWQNRFDSAEPETISMSDLEKYPTGSPIKLKDGTFVTIDGKYYLITGGERMKVEDLAIFDRNFGPSKKTGALTVNSALLEIHGASDYIDYVDDTIQDAVVATPTNTVTGNFAATFDSISPDGLIMVNGATQSVTIKFKNNGSTNWQAGDVWLKVTDKDKETSSFSVPDKVNFTETSVASSQLASFTFNLTAPSDQSGLLNQEFSLYYNKNGTPTKITSIAKFIIVKAGLSAQILEHNIPAAVRNTWKPIQITMKIKNTSADTTWLARKTALELYNQDGSTSYFYDQSDWVREEVAAVPVGKTYIQPGETGEFKFTLDPRGIKKGTYVLNFKLKLLDKEKDVYLNGGLEWHREIRVD
ncbi:MAG: hypothetical protein WC675_04155 [Patescibacteria group bacterium]|jgi:hypothetical protein